MARTTQYFGNCSWEREKSPSFQWFPTLFNFKCPCLNLCLIPIKMMPFFCVTFNIFHVIASLLGITFSSLEDSVAKALSPPRLNPSKANHAKPSLKDCNLRLQKEISRIWMKHIFIRRVHNRILWKEAAQAADKSGSHRKYMITSMVFLLEISMGYCSCVCSKPDLCRTS